MDVVAVLRSLDGVARREQLIAAGAHWRDITHALGEGFIQRTYRGVYSLPGADRSVIFARMYRARLTCVSWARALKLPLPPMAIESHLLVPRDRARRVDDRRPRERIVLHRTHSRGVGLLADPAAAIADAACCLEPRFVVALADAAIARGLLARVELLNLEHATQQLGQWLYDVVDPRAESIIESITRCALVDAGFAVRVQVAIERVGRVDLMIDDVVIECDGYEHHSKKPEFEHDRARDAELVRQGYTPLRFSYSTCMNRPEFIIATVAQALANSVARTRQ